MFDTSTKRQSYIRILETLTITYKSKIPLTVVQITGHNSKEYT